MSGSSYYLRIEGANLKQFVYDTQDLSTIRGGSFLLLDAVRRLPGALADLVALHPISTGASVGLFSLVADPGELPAIRDRIFEFLSQDLRFDGTLFTCRHATFLVDFVQAGSADDQEDPGDLFGFQERQEVLLALNRYRQMTSPTVVVPTAADVSHDDACKHVCDIDRLRPASRLEHANTPEPEWVSESVYQRRAYGRNRKRAFFKDVLEEEAELECDFTQDFKELSTHRKQTKHPLHHKMAVLYMDGNHFSRVRAQRCRKRQSESDFDERLKRVRKSFMADLVREMKDPSWRFVSGDDQKYQFETLLWGGDDLLFVVPAWNGLKTLDLFYRSLRRLDDFKGSRLHYAAGLVFCHQKAPIHRVTDLARSLAGLAKERRSENRFSYLVLESFDFVGPDLDNFLKQRRPSDVPQKEMLLDCNFLNNLESVLGDIKEGVPKRQLHRLVQNLVSQDPRSREKAAGQSEDLLALLSKAVARKLTESLGGPPKCWIHLWELWDFLPGEEAENA